MSTATIAERDPRSDLAAEQPVRGQASTSRPGARPIWFWPLETLRLVAVVYMVPLAIAAIGVILALAINAVRFGAGWVWRTAW